MNDITKSVERLLNRSESESSIEKKSVAAAKKAGWMSMKRSATYNKGNPDREYLKDGDVVYIEYKTKTGKLSKMQKKVHKDFEEHGHPVYVCRSVEETMDVLNAYA